MEAILLSVTEIKNTLTAERWESERDIWYIRGFLRPLAAYGAWFFIRLNISSKTVVVIGLVIGLLGCTLVAIGSQGIIIWGCLLLMISSWLDYVDGTVARATGTVDKKGAYLDLARDNIMSMAVPIAVGISVGMVYWGLTLALLGIWSTLALSDGREVYGKEEIYRSEGLSAWKLAFVLGTNIQAMYLLILFLAALRHAMPTYLVVFTFLTGCEVFIIILRRLKYTETQDSKRSVMEFKGDRAKLYENLEWAKEPSFVDTVVDMGRFKPTDTVLDVGTGTGIMARAIAPLVSEVVGIDISNDMLILAHNNTNIRLVVGDIRASGLGSHSFDKVVARMVFHHILEDTQKAMDECYRIVRPGGMIILGEGVPPTQEIKSHYQKVFALKEERLTFMEDDLVNLLRRSGFSEVETTVIWQKKMSIRNWLANSGLPDYTQNQIFDMFPASREACERAYNMVMMDGDCFINMKNVIVTGKKVM